MLKTAFILAAFTIHGSNNIFFGVGACTRVIIADCSICIGRTEIPEGSDHVLAIEGLHPKSIWHIDSNLHQKLWNKLQEMNIEYPRKNAMNEDDLKDVENNWNKVCGKEGV